jgi:hypothetical protein
MTKAIQYKEKGMFVYKLDEMHVCSLVETEPDSWEIVCLVRKKRLGTYSKAKKLTDDFVGMLKNFCEQLPGKTLSEQQLTLRFDEFIAYRLIS